MSDDQYWMRADEFMENLKKDPSYQQRIAAREQRRAERRTKLDAIKKPVIEDLRIQGIEVESIDELSTRYAPLSQDIVNVLLSWLRRISNDRIRESIVRALGAAEHSFDGRSLADIYDTTYDEGLRFAILNTIALTKPHSIDSWLTKARENPKARETLTNLANKRDKPTKRI